MKPIQDTKRKPSAAEPSPFVLTIWCGQVVCGQVVRQLTQHLLYLVYFGLVRLGCSGSAHPVRPPNTHRDNKSPSAARSRPTEIVRIPDLTHFRSPCFCYLHMDRNRGPTQFDKVVLRKGRLKLVEIGGEELPDFVVGDVPGGYQQQLGRLSMQPERSDEVSVLGHHDTRLAGDDRRNGGIGGSIRQRQGGNVHHIVASAAEFPCQPSG